MGLVLSEWKILCSTAFLQETPAKTPVFYFLVFSVTGMKRSLQEAILLALNWTH